MSTNLSKAMIDSKLRLPRDERGRHRWRLLLNDKWRVLLVDMKRLQAVRVQMDPRMCSMASVVFEYTDLTVELHRPNAEFQLEADIYQTVINDVVRVWRTNYYQGAKK